MGMRTRTPALMVMALSVALAGGCASRATSAGAASAPTPTNTSGCPSALTVTAADASKTECVQVGGTVTVQLNPVDDKPWLAIDVSGTNLQPATSTPDSTPSGGQGAIYTAATAGTVDITSAYRACPQKPGTVSCNAIVAWKTTIDIKP
jgi:hypothetical protein